MAAQQRHKNRERASADRVGGESLPERGVKQHPLWKPKFLVTAYVLLSATALLIFGKLDGGSWVAVVNLALATFVAGSVYENKVLK